MVTRTLSDFGDSHLPHHDLGAFVQHLRRCLFPLFGLLVCFHILTDHSGVFSNREEANSIYEELNRVVLKSGRDLTVVLEYTFFPRLDGSEVPVLDTTYGLDYILLHHQQVVFLGSYCSVMYIQFPSAEAAVAALKTGELSNHGFPVEMRVFGVFVVRITAPDVILFEFAETAFSEIEKNLNLSH